MKRKNDRSIEKFRDVNINLFNINITNKGTDSSLLVTLKKIFSLFL